MIRTLSLSQVIVLHTRLIAQSGGGSGIRDLGALASALAQPGVTFDHKELYPDVVAKAAVLAHALIQNHPFVDGNKRIGHAAMEVFLVLNHHELRVDVDEAEAIILRVASGLMMRDEFTAWVRAHVTEIK